MNKSTESELFNCTLYNFEHYEDYLGSREQYFSLTVYSSTPSLSHPLSFSTSNIHPSLGQTVALRPPLCSDKKERSSGRSEMPGIE